MTIFTRTQQLEARFFRLLNPFIVGAAAAFLLIHVFFALTGSYRFNQFDGALRLLPHIYISQGLTPYQDFAVVYPPGQFLLLGEVLPYLGVVSRTLLFGSLLIVFFGMALTLIRALRSTKHTMGWKTFAFTSLCLSWCVVAFMMPADIFSPMLFLLTVLFLFAHAKDVYRQSGVLFSLFVCGLIAVFFRWDWPVFLGLLQFGLLVVLGTTALFLPAWKPQAISTLKSTLAFAGGVTAGLLALSLYFAITSSLSQGWEMIFTLPTQVILQGRRLPVDFSWRLWKISALLSGIVLAWSAALVLSAVHLFFHVRRRSPELFPYALALTAPLAVLPYAIGRADWEHALPLALAIMLAITLVSQTWRLQVLRWVTLLFVVAPLSSLLTFRSSSALPWQWNKAEKNISVRLGECQTLLSSATAESMFVGRVSYTSFVINTPLLYLARPDLLPATRFISDEPNLQNSCEYGRRIADDLERAPKPMLAILEEKPQKPEANSTSFMLSCGSIEAFLAEKPFTTIGTCKAAEKDFTIRIYGEEL